MNTEQREMIEREYLALIIFKPEIIDLLQIKPKYLCNKSHSTLLQQMIETYTMYNLLHVVKMAEMYQKDFDILLYTDIATNEIHFEKSWKKRLEYYEDYLLKAYKEDVISSLNKKLDTGELKYDEFVVKIKKIDDIQLVKKSNFLDITEITENIDTKKIGIFINNFIKLNKVLGLVQGDFLIVGATTGGGKSGFLLNLLNGLMNDYQCIYFNMEMSKSTIYKRMISINSGIPISDINNPKSELQKEFIDKSIQRIQDAKVIVEHEAVDVISIKNVVSKFSDDERHTIIFIDHIGLTKNNDKKSIYEATTDAMKQLRQICVKYNCTIIGASQMNRSAYGTNEMTLNMLKDSGEVENSASKILLIYMDENEDKESIRPRMIVDVAKNRDGSTGLIHMQYDKTKQIFREY